MFDAMFLHGIRSNFGTLKNRPPSKHFILFFQLIEDPVESMLDDPNRTVVTPLFDPIVEVLREQEAYPILSFVADFGGILGLFIGFNFLMVWGCIVWCCRHMLAMAKLKYKS